MKREVGTWKTVRSEGGSGQRLIHLELRVVIRKKVGTGGGSRRMLEAYKKSITRKFVQRRL